MVPAWGTDLIQADKKKEEKQQTVCRSFWTALIAARAEGRVGKGHENEEWGFRSKDPGKANGAKREPQDR
jgi:hypothetical protein